jgi:2-dehydro-3-deoxyphosphogluconate aldolase / (4S)-4-hydroxy-2-oxoglutarate aldolase
MTELRSALRRLRVLPLLVSHNAAGAADLGAALVAGGLPAVEVTFRTDAAEDAIREMSSVPGLLVGAGTVVRVDQVHTAVDAGATFVVTPGFSPAVVRECAALEVPVIPGVATATEVLTALDHGLSLLKFFPAETMGGPPALRALAAPFGAVEFLPTGGVTAASISGYLALDCVVAVGGSWMLPADEVASGDVETVTSLAAAAVTAAEAAGRAGTAA